MPSIVMRVVPVAAWCVAILLLVPFASGESTARARLLYDVSALAADLDEVLSETFVHAPQTAEVGTMSMNSTARTYVCNTSL